MHKFLIGAAVLAVAAPASAVTVTAIRVTNTVPTWLQVAEVQAFGGATNWAAAANGATALGSGNYEPSSSPDQAIDGDTDGAYPNIYHSDGTGADEFLLVTLGQARDITELTLWGRTDCCSARDTFGYELLNGATVVASGTLDASGAGNRATATFAPAGAVPEPAAWALMIAGFGLAGGAMRRRATGVVFA